LYEVGHAIFASKDKRGDYPWTRGKEEAPSDTLTLILYHMDKWGIYIEDHIFESNHNFFNKKSSYINKHINKHM
jgi:hypothetical protein